MHVVYFYINNYICTCKTLEAPSENKVIIILIIIIIIIIMIIMIIIIIIIIIIISVE